MDKEVSHNNLEGRAARRRTVEDLLAERGLGRCNVGCDDALGVLERHGGPAEESSQYFDRKESRRERESLEGESDEVWSLSSLTVWRRPVATECLGPIRKQPLRRLEASPLPPTWSSSSSICLHLSTACRSRHRPLAGGHPRAGRLSRPSTPRPARRPRPAPYP